MLKSVINFGSLLCLAVLGAILGGEYQNPIHLVGLGGLLGYSVAVQILILANEKANGDLNAIRTENESLKNELANSKLKLSQLLLQSNQFGENRLYLALHPIGGGAINPNSKRTIQIVMNAPFGISPPPDIKIITKQTWGVIEICGEKYWPRSFGSEYEYTLSSSRFTNLENCSDKFFSMIFHVKFHREGIYEYVLEAKSRDFHSRISNSFEVA